MISAAQIRDAIAAALDERGAGKTVCPSEVARTLAGTDETVWRRMMAPIRHEAVAMAKSGELRILRKGRPVDPDAFKGIYRLALPEGT